ncbi:hypothetical protein ZIOFF_045807 [Zingiber officinale]|uniref:Uncharacterized protein n=1 Tax=Zingiber officinale TaxID=94328 RepID=A0A8J5G152_ZINOF|nr:hypothetical protein ZIOFF_045807 [Zingiber officinale]
MRLYDCASGAIAKSAEVEDDRVVRLCFKWLGSRVGAGKGESIGGMPLLYCRRRELLAALLPPPLSEDQAQLLLLSLLTPKTI